MAAKILDGKALAEKIKGEVRREVEQLREKGTKPGLAVVIVGNDPASRTYVNSKRKDCAEVGIESFEYALDESTSEQELVELIKKLNGDPAVSGILVQLPLPKHISEDRVIYTIDPAKDADCFHPTNVGNLMIGKPTFMPCTPAGVMELIKESGIEISGKECVVVGRSNIVGKPQAMLLLAQNGTVTVCHSRTKDLAAVCRRADILVAAIGKPGFIDGSYIKSGAVVIDVGINRTENKKLVGDVDFASASEAASAITPVPGGVGPMTRAMLLRNTVTAAKLRK